MAKNPTVLPIDNFDPEQDAKDLKQAFKGFGTDEQAIVEIITKRSNEQRLQIASMFKTLYGKDLINELKSELRGNFEDVIIALMTQPIEYQAKQLHKAINGLGTDEKTIVEILSIHNNEEIIKIIQEYEGLYQRPLETDIKEDTSGTIKRLFISLSTGNRDESNEIDENDAFNDAQALLQAGELQFGTEESVFNQILCQRNKKQLNIVFEQYEKITGNTIEKAIENEFSGTAKDAILDLIQCIRNPIDYLTKRLHDSMSGIGTDDKTLIRIIVGRSEIDLGDIKRAFEEKYDESLVEFVKGEASGDYKKCLLSIIA